VNIMKIATALAAMVTTPGRAPASAAHVAVPKIAKDVTNMPTMGHDRVGTRSPGSGSARRESESGDDN
jgi:hypothetical protein